MASAVENTTLMNKTAVYKHKNLNSIYYLKPGSHSLFFLDFQKKGFIEESLLLPGNNVLHYGFTSVQVNEGDIYMIGGFNTNPFNVMNTLLLIEGDLNVSQLASMSEKRYSAPCQLV